MVRLWPYSSPDFSRSGKGNFCECQSKMSLTEQHKSYPTDDGPQVSMSPSNLFEGARSIYCLLQRGLGAIFVLAALALWVLPGASWTGDDAIVKLAVSLTLGFSGLALWQMGSKSHRLEIELDTETYEVRLSIVIMGKAISVLNCNFNDLSRVDQSGDHLTLWSAHGEILAQVEMCQSEVRKRLPIALQEAGLLNVVGARSA